MSNHYHHYCQELYDFDGKTKQISASSLRSLEIIYETSQVYTILSKPISWVLETEVHVVSTNV